MTTNKFPWKILGTVALFTTGAYIWQTCNSQETTPKSKLEQIIEKKHLKKQNHPEYLTEKKESQEESQELFERKTKIDSIKQNSYHPKQLKEEKEKPAALKDKNLTENRNFIQEEDCESLEDIPDYYVPLEGRNFDNPDDPLYYFYDALRAKDYRIAEGYIKDIQKHYPNISEHVENSLRTIIESDYDDYLTDVIKNCDKHDSLSVKIKIAQMDMFFFPNDEDEIKKTNFHNKGLLANKMLNDCVYN